MEANLILMYHAITSKTSSRDHRSLSEETLNCCVTQYQGCNGPDRDELYQVSYAHDIGIVSESDM